MPDHGARYTDQQIDAIEKRITALYDTAYNDVRRKYLAFIQKFKREDEKYRQMLADCDITKAQYDAWLRGQVFQGERWKAQLSDIAQTLTNATIAATDVINENATNVFAMNANYAQYEIEKAGNADFGFGLYDEDTVRRLVRDDPNLLPPSKVDIPLEQQWNKTLINRQIGASIVIGEGIEAAAKRLQRAANMSANQARTHARTAMTGAQNAGRIEGYHRAEQMGIKLEKEWLATLDGHTRRSHAMLDGQHVPVDKPFKSLLGDIMYPGDPSARPANVYNCRCTLISHLLDYPSQNAQRRPNLQRLGDAEVQKPIKDMTYAEWAGWKTKSLKDNKEYQERIRMRREAFFKRKTAPDFDSMQRSELEKYVHSNFQTKFGDLSGVNGDYIRETAKAVYAFEEKAHGKTIPNLRIEFGGLSSNVYAKYDDKNRILRLKKTGSLKVFENAQKSVNERSMRKLGKGYYAVPTYQGTVWHELGHAIDINAGQRYSKELNKTEELSVESTRISIYAADTGNVRVSKRSEAWAENFSAYMAGGKYAERVPAEIAEMIAQSLEELGKSRKE